MFFKGLRFVVFRTEADFNEIAEFHEYLDMPNTFIHRPHWQVFSQLIEKPTSYPAYYESDGCSYKKCSKFDIIKCYIDDKKEIEQTLNTLVKM